MNLQLTDILTCPRCREGGGLILLADRVDGRRVLAGQLGCPNCRARYAVVDGVAQFGDTAVPRPQSSDMPDAALVAALLGVTEGPAQLLVIGPYEQFAEELAALLTDVEIVIASSSAIATAEVEGVSRMQIGDRIPLRDGSMRGVLISGRDAAMITEAVRVIALAARVVLIDATTTAHAALAAEGVHIVAKQDDKVVAVRQS
jgi:uncharacterized protein YbaR (Trm112 family)